MKKICWFAMAWILSGCVTQTFTLAVNTPPMPDATQQVVFYFGGLGQNREVNAGKICGGASRVAKVTTGQSGGEALLSAITLGIYSPRTVSVYCAVK
jgi:Bor protein